MTVSRWGHWFHPRMTIGLDLVRMGSGGQNGGIKPLIFQLIQEIHRLGLRVRFHFFVSSGMVAETLTLCGPHDRCYCVSESETVPWSNLPTNKRLILWKLPEEQPTRASALDVLVAAFGYSSLRTPKVPFAPLIVDLLHRDLPEYLPIDEVEFREQRLSESVAVADVVLTISKFTAQRLMKLFSVPADRCGVFYNTAHARLPSLQPLTLPAVSPYFLFPANFWPHKNHEGLLIAYRQYLAKAGQGSWDLVFTGAETERSSTLRKIAESLKISPKVQFMGHLDDHPFSRLWMQAGALVYPSLYEGFGIPLLEAMAFRVPIICSNVASLPEVANTAALMFDPRKPSSIAARMLELANDPTLRERLCNLGSERLKAFNASTEARRFVEYLNLARRNHRR